jgi:hypothetical protein
MSALGWELPLDAICIDGSFAQFVSLDAMGGKQTFAAQATNVSCATK